MLIAVAFFRNEKILFITCCVLKICYYLCNARDGVTFRDPLSFQPSFLTWLFYLYYLFSLYAVNQIKLLILGCSLETIEFCKTSLEVLR